MSRGRDELAARLLTLFTAELDEQLRAMNADLLALEKNPSDRERLQAVFRAAHTLKGAAGAAGVRAVEQTCHALESLLSRARDGEFQLGAEGFSLLFTVADELSYAGAEIKAGREPTARPLTALRDRLKEWRPTPAAPVESAALQEKPAPAQRTAPVEPHSPAPGPAVERAESDVRVAVENLDAVFAGAAQLMVARGSARQIPNGLANLLDATSRSAREWTRTSRRLRLAVERSSLPASLGSVIGEMETGWKSLVDELGRLTARAADDARSFVRAADEVADGVHRLRLRPFAEACETLPRMIRDVATSAHKEVDLDVIGGDVQIDGAMLGPVREALLHLTRNAVDHGIEAPDQREQRGKNRTGKVTITAALQGGGLRVSVADDGAGLDLPAVRRKLEERGQTIPPNERDVAQALFASGFSTKAEATAISGRGVGLDVVRVAVERLRGTVDVTWKSGQGTTFVIDCPQSLATIRAVLVTVGAELLAIPTMHVERLLRVDPAEVKRAEGRDVILTGEAPVPLVALARLLPPIVQRTATGSLPVIVLRAGWRRVAVIVDELIGEDEMVLRPINHAGTLPHVSGASILGGGQIALVLNPVALVDTGSSLTGDGEVGGAVPDQTTVRRRILLVDDSITTRTLEQSILTAAGFEVATAVDGTDAWSRLQEWPCELVISDVEMPRMDGVALCRAIRGSQRLKDLPVILVTALESADARARGFEAGADAYVGKSSFDQQALLDTVERLLGDR